MTLLLSDKDIRSCFNWRAAVEALGAAYARPLVPESLPRRTMARSEGVWLRTLSGVVPEGGPMGAKLIAASMTRRRASYLISLFDQDTTELKALLDGNAITGYRTAATSVLALDRLVPDGPVEVAIVGSGFEAQHHLRALAAIRTVARATVYSPSSASRQRFISELSDVDVPITAAEYPEDAAVGANVVICAARSRDESPTFLADWAMPGMTIVSVGSTLPEQRELDWKLIDRSALIVADMPSEVANDTGDLLAAREAGVDVSDRLDRKSVV